MPLISPRTPFDPENAQHDSESTQPQQAGSAESPTTASPEPPHDPKAPLSFVPHSSSDNSSQMPFRIRTGRYGELEEHELVKLLDSIEDERAKARFRESVYISVFIWLVVAWVAFYGPRYLWHAPKVIDPMSALRERELTVLNAPVLPHTPVMHSAPKIDTKTLAHLRETAPKPTPQPTEAPPPAPSTNMTPTPVAPPPPPTPANVTPRPAPNVPDAPMPSAPKPSFSSGNSSSNPLGSYSSRSGGGDTGLVRTPRGAAAGTGGIEVLSDTHGVDLTAWLRRMHTDIENNWFPLLPVETQPPLMKQGDAAIIVRIGLDGSIQDMRMDGSSHDDAINHSAWGSITSEGQFSPLPGKGALPFLVLRLHYYVNEQPR